MGVAGYVEMEWGGKTPKKTRQNQRKKNGHHRKDGEMLSISNKKSKFCNLK